MKAAQLEFAWRDACSLSEESKSATPPSPPCDMTVVEVGAADLRTSLIATEQATAAGEAPSDPPAENRRPAGYDPGHPWYYYSQGDNRSPLAVAEVPAADGEGCYNERCLPKNPSKRERKIHELLAAERLGLESATGRYQEIAERGARALTRYDREIAYGGNDDLARASSLALTFNHIAWHRGRVEWLERELNRLAGTQ